MKIVEGKNVPIKSWCNYPESGALDQAKNLASLPFVFKHIALMPDTHQGYGMPIGGVLATHNVIIPNFVGVDIGCGMCAVRTSLTEMPIELLKRIRGGSKKYQGGIFGSIPVGKGQQHKKAQDENLMPVVSQIQKARFKNGYVCVPCEELYPIVCSEYMSALKQLGTLGSGNHFIEIQRGSDGYIWIMIHSGSRRLGYDVAKHYNTLAQEMCKKWYSNIPPFKGQDGLAFFPLDTKEGQDYLREMNYCLEYAKANRYWMINKVKEIFKETVENYWMTDKEGLSNVTFDEIINIHHNYATIENHFGKNVVIHRKGATSARKGQIGIIPGSQGTSSYIVKGLGNPESFNSCSHGAGRAMSRTKARENLSLEEEQKKLDDKGILHSIRGKKNLDEASSAYKDIAVVMEEQKDLVEILVKLSPLAVVKG